MAEILTFPATASSKARKGSWPAFTRKWADQHFPLIEAAMDLHRANGDEFRKRCLTIEETEGRSVLRKMASQLDRLAAHIAGLVSALSMTSRRIRNIIAEGAGA